MIRIIETKDIQTTEMLCWSCSRRPAKKRVTVLEGAALVNICVCDGCNDAVGIRKILERDNLYDERKESLK